VPDLTAAECETAGGSLLGLLAAGVQAAVASREFLIQLFKSECTNWEQQYLECIVESTPLIRPNDTIASMPVPATNIARDRIMLVHGPEMLHRSKRISKRFNGHKAAIGVDAVNLLGGRTYGAQRGKRAKPA
jgi:hypothetical protein